MEKLLSNALLFVSNLSFTTSPDYIENSTAEEETDV